MLYQKHFYQEWDLGLAVFMFRGKTWLHGQNTQEWTLRLTFVATVQEMTDKLVLTVDLILLRNNILLV